MRTDDLIRALAADTVRSRPLGAVLGRALAVAALVVIAAAIPILGFRAYPSAALAEARVLLKQTYPILLAVGAFGAALHLARPGDHVGRWLLPIAAVPVLLAVAVVAELEVLPRGDWMAAFVGHTSRFCLTAISLMSLPLLAAALWALRRGASTRPTLTGAAAGLLSGGTAAAIYAIHCTEDSPLFYAFWYVLAILLATALGALAGRRVLRW
jgi:hypothetical protein